MNKTDVIIALDFKDAQETFTFLDKFTEEKPFVKVGMELFYGEGPQIVREIKARGHNIFLDLKLHDIPMTVEKAMRNLARLGVNMTNLHAAGTIEMMKGALHGLEEGATGTERAILLAVTQLTSTSTEIMNKELLLPGDINDVIVHYAKNTKEAGLDGVVCSPLEASIVKDACGTGFLTVTPGIRYPGAGNQDQVRVTSPADAKAIGTDYIVVGRPITAQENPVEAYRRIVKDFIG